MKPLKKDWSWYFFWGGFFFFVSTTALILGLTISDLFARPHTSGTIQIHSLSSGTTYEWSPDTCTYDASGVGITSKKSDESLSFTLNAESFILLYSPTKASWKNQTLICSSLTGIVNGKPKTSRPSSLLSPYWTGSIEMICHDQAGRTEISGRILFSHCGPLEKFNSNYFLSFIPLIPFCLYFVWRKYYRRSSIY